MGINRCTRVSNPADQQLPQHGYKQDAPMTHCWHAGELAVLSAATEPLTTRPSVDFPSAINAACLHADRAGWIAKHAGHVVGARRRAACHGRTSHPPLTPNA